MQCAVTRYSGLASRFTARVCVAPSLSHPVDPNSKASSEVPAQPFFPEDPLKCYSVGALYGKSPQSGLLKSIASTKIGVSIPARSYHSHTDIKVPSWGPHRKDQGRHADKRTRDEARKAFQYTVTLAIAVPTTWFARHMVCGMVNMLNPSRAVQAVSKTEINLNKIPEGKNVTYVWRDRPLFVRHRTEEEIEIEGQVDHTKLRDPETDADRAKIPKWLVVVGVCTHLGCTPIAYQGKFNGYYCPCHGSHYDASGRIRIGPAPSNLVVPPHEFTEDNMLIVG